MFCTKCGQSLPEGCKFCTRCGAPTDQQTQGAKPPVSVASVKKQVEKKGTVLDLVKDTGTAMPEKQVPVVPAPVAPAASGTVQSGPKTSKGSTLGMVLAGIVVILGVGAGGLWYFQPEFVQKIPFLAQEKTKTADSRAVPEKNRTAESTQSRKPSETKPAEPAVQKDSAEYAFRAYHKALTAHQLREAYQYFAPDFRQSMGDYESWSAGYATTVSSIPEKVSVLSESPSQTVLSFRLKATDQANGNENTNYFVGQCTMVKLGGEWKIEEITAQKAD